MESNERLEQDVVVRWTGGLVHVVGQGQDKERFYHMIHNAETGEIISERYKKKLGFKIKMEVIGKGTRLGVIAFPYPAIKRVNNYERLVKQLQAENNLGRDLEYFEKLNLEVA